MIINFLIYLCLWNMAALWLTLLGRWGVRYRIRPATYASDLYSVEYRHIMWMGPWLVVESYLSAEEAAALLNRSLGK